jgi:1-acylglycerone phosphate reductase
VYEAPAIESDPVRIRTMFNANVFGVFDMVSAFTPLLLASSPTSCPSRPPTIVNTASILAKVPYPFSAAYNATKAAVASYSDTLRLELAPLGIMVVTLYMGVVSTGISSPETIRFDPESLYADVEGKIKERSREHQVSGMKADKFANEVVQELMKNRGLGQGESVWKGANATVVWFISSIWWRKVLE